MKLTLKFYLNISWSMFADSPKIMSSCWKLEWNLLILIVLPPPVDFGPVFYTLTMIGECVLILPGKEPLESKLVKFFFSKIDLKWVWVGNTFSFLPNFVRHGNCHRCREVVGTLRVCLFCWPIFFRVFPVSEVNKLMSIYEKHTIKAILFLIRIFVYRTPNWWIMQSTPFIWIFYALFQRWCRYLSF